MTQTFNIITWYFRGSLKSPWSRRKRKRALTKQQWKSLFTPEGKLRDGGVKFLKKVRSGVSTISAWTCLQFYGTLFLSTSSIILLIWLLCRESIQASGLRFGLSFLECKITKLAVFEFYSMCLGQSTNCQIFICLQKWPYFTLLRKLVEHFCDNTMNWSSLLVVFE